MFSGLVAFVMALIALITPPAESGRTDLTEADVAVLSDASTQPEPRDAAWPCTQPLVIRPAIAPGVPETMVDQQLRYPVATLQGLGYTVTVGAPVTYRPDIDPTTVAGEVLVVVTDKPAQQRDLNGAKAARTRQVFVGSEIWSAAVYIDAAGGALAGDIILHELGHVLGLGHKEQTVMGESWDSPPEFDAAQLAAIDCR